MFILPGERAKNREDRLVVWNRTARSIVEEARPDNAHHVFTYKGKPASTINNSAWKGRDALPGWYRSGYTT